MVGAAPHDQVLLDALDHLAPAPYNGAVWRATWATRDPLRGSSAGGRWTPANSFEALNTSLESDGAMAETYYHLSRAPVFSSAHLKLHKLNVQTKSTLDLRDLTQLETLGVERAILRTTQYHQTQAIGSAARFLEYDSLLVPSARWACANLVLFLDRLDLGDALVVEESMDINWPAWKEKNGPS